MRTLVIASACLIAACSGQARVSGGTVRQALDLPTAGEARTPNAIAATRGSALPPPPPAGAAGQAAPPEGQAPGGIDFGQWRSADPAVYGPAFQAQMRTRYAAGGAAARPDLERNGFACRDRERALECRIEIMERQCARDWYVVFEAARAEPIAGFDVMCLGAARR
jgi:hypothetical protein